MDYGQRTSSADELRQRDAQNNDALDGELKKLAQNINLNGRYGAIIRSWADSLRPNGPESNILIKGSLEQRLDKISELFDSLADTGNSFGDIGDFVFVQNAIEDAKALLIKSGDIVQRPPEPPFLSYMRVGIGRIGVSDDWVKWWLGDVALYDITSHKASLLKNAVMEKFCNDILKGTPVIDILSTTVEVNPIHRYVAINIDLKEHKEVAAVLATYEGWETRDEK